VYSLIAGSSQFKCATLPSTWTGSRHWWRDQAQIDGTDWQSLLDCVDRVLHRLCAVHVAVGASS
jgi:hypothetical protein